jgi:hypothetical protein
MQNIWKQRKKLAMTEEECEEQRAKAGASEH